MSTDLDAIVGKPWKKPSFIKNPALRWGLVVLAVVYFYFAFTTIDVNWARIYRGLDRGWQFILGFANPDFASRWSDIYAGFMESVVMTVASTVAGIVISIPIALGAARNIAPLPVYMVCRFIVSISRALNEIIVAIILVKIFGFGPLAGFLTLSFATIGFLSKLLAEEIESMNMVAPEAIQSTGSSWAQWINFGVQPQVMPRLIGLSMYRLDINFRESAVLGLVGAGGIGATLNTAFDRYEFDSVAAILLIIIITVMSLEYLSGVIRERIK